MNNKIIEILSAAFAVLLCLSCGGGTPADNSGGAQVSPTRIISFAPSITEILYELDLGDRIQGVTRFCNYPPDAAQKRTVGGHADYSYEMILRLKPDLAVILKEQRDLAAFLDKYRIRYIAVGSDSVDEIIESVRLIADAVMVSDRGEALAQKLLRHVGAGFTPAQIHGEINRATARVAPTNCTDAGTGDRLQKQCPAPPRPKILLCVGRENIGGGAVSRCFAAGALSFYNQLIEIAGGVNVLQDTRQAYPAIGAEAVIRLNPDIIIDISSAYSDLPPRQVCGDWNALSSVAAVKNENVYCLQGDFLTIPGPRFVLILDKFRDIFGGYNE